MSEHELGVVLQHYTKAKDIVDHYKSIHQSDNHERIYGVIVIHTIMIEK